MASVLQVKAEKCGSNMWTEVHELAALLREGTTKWEDLNLDDVDIRMKFAGLFHRGKRTPQRFMMRLKVWAPCCFNLSRWLQLV
jgi:ferredoxin-nitrite reductase